MKDFDQIKKEVLAEMKQDSLNRLKEAEQKREEVERKRIEYENSMEGIIQKKLDKYK